MDSRVVLKINISMNLHVKKSERNPYRRMKDICLWSHTALNRNKHVYEFLPLPLLSHDLIPHSTQISQHNQETFEETE
jgi:hypothetical protein